MTDATAVGGIDPEKAVDKAAAWAMALWTTVHRGMGDNQDNSMHAAARLAQVPPNTLWRLRYRRPRSIEASIYLKLEIAHRKFVQSTEATVAQNLIALRALPSTPARTRLMAQMEEYLRDQESDAADVG